MADFTPNYNLKKPLRTEYYNVADANGNSDIVDTQLKAVNDRVDLVEGEVDALELGKVDKVVGQGLSDENYTLIEKNKLAGIEENATADMTALEIKTEYESNADTNAYTDAEKAKVANLPADTNAQLADIEQRKVENFKIKNEIVNGDFSNGSAGWTVNSGALSVNANVLTLTSNIKSPLVSTLTSRISGHKYYQKLTVKPLTSGLISVVLTGFTISIEAKPTVNQVNVITGISTASSTGGTSLTITSNYDVAKSSTMEVSYAMVIDLTKTFGAGNEPTKLEMDELMKVIPNGWWNGELSLTQKQYITWQLNLIRKNTNAIIALGGTIV